MSPPNFQLLQRPSRLTSCCACVHTHAQISAGDQRRHRRAISEQFAGSCRALFCCFHEWFSTCACVTGAKAGGGLGEFICTVLKMHVQHLLSGAALEMFLSCCRSLLLSWRISSRSLASPSSPPVTWSGDRWIDSEEEIGAQRKNYISNTVTFFKAIYSGMLDGCMTFQLKRYSKHQWGHRQAISQPTGCVNSSRGANLTIYSIHGTYAKVESAQSLTLNLTTTAVITRSPLSPWLLIPALRSLAIWANSLSFSSFFSFSFWAIFFSTWALISTASLAWGRVQNYYLNMNLRGGLFQMGKKIWTT